jgi:hypothetical protein
MGMGEPRVLGAGERAMLAELRWRAEKAYRMLDELFSKEARYFHEKAELLIRELDLPSAKALMLLDFAEKLVDCLYRAYPQAKTRLERLLIALERTSVKVEPSPRGEKTLHVTPMGEGWHVTANRTDEWMFQLPLHGISAKASFPDILGLKSEALYYLQSGWRASDESEDKGFPRMRTSQEWQVFAWVTARYGSLYIRLDYLSINKSDPTIKWDIRAEDWKQQWPSKKTAQQIAERHPLSLLTWYLGDGERHSHSLAYAVGKEIKYKPKRLVAEMLEAAYQTGYGELLDLLGCEKWAALKRLRPKERPVHATLRGHTFWLYYHEGNRALQACSLFKSLDDAAKLAKALADMGVQARICTQLSYHILQLNGHSTLKLAEKYPEWRRALRELAQKRNLQPRTPLLRRLLELAENPPRALQERFGCARLTTM